MSFQEGETSNKGGLLPSSCPQQEPSGLPEWYRHQFRDLVNSRGGDCTIVYLPDVGINGNSHFMFQELNNMEIADLIQSWLEERGLN